MRPVGEGHRHRFYAAGNCEVSVDDEEVSIELARGSTGSAAAGEQPRRSNRDQAGGAGGSRPHADAVARLAADPVSGGREALHAIADKTSALTHNTRGIAGATDAVDASRLADRGKCRTTRTDAENARGVIATAYAVNTEWLIDLDIAGTAIANGIGRDRRNDPSPAA